MKSENIAYNPRLDEIRGIACLLVFVFHIKWELQNSILLGWGMAGVLVFFILSGYLFTSIYNTREEFPYKKFFVGRFFRIFPALVLYIITVSFYTKSFPLGAFKDLFTTNTQHLFTYPNLFYHFVGHLWTIVIDIYFYLVFPMLLFLYKKTLWVIMGIAFLIGFFTTPWMTSFWYSVPFLLGMLLYSAHKNRTITKYVFSKVSLVLSFIVILLMIYVFRNPLQHLFLYLILISLFVGSYAIRDKIPILSPVALFYGRMGYSFYIWHIFCLTIVLDHIIPVHPHYILFFVVVLGITTLVAMISYNLIEKPFMRLRQKYQGKGRWRNASPSKPLWV